VSEDHDGGDGRGDDGAAERTAEDRLALVGNEIRVAILRALGDERVRSVENPVLSFSELRSRIEPESRSSQFNYHLQQLVGTFLEQTDAGYRLRTEGWLLYTRLAAGTYDTREASLRTPAGFDCHYCGAAAAVSVDDAQVRVHCPDCEYRYEVTALPPGAAGDGSADAGADDGSLGTGADDGADDGSLGAGDIDVAAVGRYAAHEHLGFARGVCTTCGGTLDATVVPPADTPFETDPREVVHVRRACDHCGTERYLSVGEALLADPGLVAFCHEHDVDVFETPLWELGFTVTDRGVTVRSTDPWRVALTVAYGDDELELVVDGDLEVVERTRS
jgi:hypothetical protein